jgi:hypothetical protein
MRTCENLETQVLSVVSKIVHQDLVKLNYQIVHLSGGNTNILYHAFPSGDENVGTYLTIRYS